jgi:hypothetical protein
MFKMLSHILLSAVTLSTVAFGHVVTHDSAVTRETNLPSSFNWTSSDILISPKNDGRGVAGVKDPSIIYYKGTYHVFASTAQSAGYSMIYLNFTDYAEASSAPFFYLDQSGIGTGYRAAPEVFYFKPHKLWYLVYQDGNAAYSTNPDISDPAGWTAPQHFYDDMPTIIADNIGEGYWVDMWVICDATDCHLFSSDDNGHLYRSQTPISQFPAGFNDPEIAMSDPNRFALFEASNVYSVKGTDEYVLIIEAIGSDGRRYFRSWNSTSIAGPWTGLADSEENPFARASNVVFNGTPWTNDTSHGEVVRTSVDQTLTIPGCDLQYLYQGLDPSAGGDYNSLPWRIALLTQTNAPCKRPWSPHWK